MSKFRLVNVLITASVLLATILWLISLAAPILNGNSGITVVFGTLIVGWAFLPLGPWAVLANITIPLACSRIVSRRGYVLPLVLSIAFPATSPMFWHILTHAGVEQWGIVTWTASIVTMAIAGLVATIFSTES